MYGGYNQGTGYNGGPPPGNNYQQGFVQDPNYGYNNNNNFGGMNPPNMNNNNYMNSPQSFQGQNNNYYNNGSPQNYGSPQNFNNGSPQNFNSPPSGYNSPQQPNYAQQPPPQGGYETTYNPNAPSIQHTAQQLQQEIPNYNNSASQSPSNFNSNNNNPISPNAYQVQQAMKPAHNYGEGRRKALLIGVNYIGQATHLQGPANDTKNMFTFLSEEFSFPPDNMLIMTDEPQTQKYSYINGAMHNTGDIKELIPVKANILKAISWLVSDARPGDTLFFMYSGHGGQVPDKTGDEVDGMDEVIFPLDYLSGNHLIDDDLHDAMIKRLPEGCRLLCLMDCCHSGSGLDLPYLKSAYESKKRRERAKGAKVSRGQSLGLAVCWSSCQDSETSADIGVNGVYSGALTHFWLAAIKKHGGGKNGGGSRGSYEDILMSIWDGMQEKVTTIVSIPQLSYNAQDFDIRQPFYF